MSEDTVYALLWSIPICVVTGIYAGMITAKYSRFATLRSEALRVVRGLNYMGEGSRIEFLEGSDLSHLSLIQSELFQLGHKSAGEIVGQVENEAVGARREGEAGRIEVEWLSARHLDWQERLRLLRFPKLHFLWPFGGL